MKISGHYPFSPIVFEAIPYFVDTTSIELIFLYRINPAFFFFIKAGSMQQEAYEAKGELVIEILDNKEASITRDFRQIQIKQNYMPSESSQPLDEIKGALTFRLKKGSYKIIVEVKDNESGKSFINRDTKIETEPYTLIGLNMSPLVFVERAISDALTSDLKKILPVNHGGNVIIGQTGGCLFQVSTPDTITELQLSWKIICKQDDFEEENPQELHGEQFYQFTGIPAVVAESKNIFFTINNNSKYSRCVYVPIPLERLESGKYQLTTTVIQNALKSEKEYSFNVIWPLKPRSLIDFKIAISALRHIANEEEMNQMNAFSSSKSIKVFREFWKKRSPDTTCAFNPTMAEYYRRVDESIKRFSVGDKPDGYRTDRGRIFILFGSPTVTNRLLKPNSGPTEIWTYEQLKQRFTFTDTAKTGNYILIKSENY